jgi:hypothetical protein
MLSSAVIAHAASSAALLADPAAFEGHLTAAK